MGRPPHGGGPVFRFTQNEVTEMEACLIGLNNAIPAREMICGLAEKFSASADRAGKTVVQPKQVWNWFQNRRYSQRTKVKAPGKLNVPPLPRDDSSQYRNPSHHASVPQGQNSFENSQLEFEAKSARDGAWYDVSAFLSHRAVETDNPEVRVRFSGFGVEEDEWINVLRNVRQRSLPCENAECIAVLPGDLVLCFQEGKDQALYFDAHILDVQRRRHDVRGCRCRFLVRYDHDQSEEIVPLRKVCRRPETDSRLQQLWASRASGSSHVHASLPTGSSRDQNLMPRRIGKQRKLTDVNTDDLATIALPAVVRTRDPATQQLENIVAIVNDNKKLPQEEPTKDPVSVISNVYKLQQTMQVGKV